MSYFSNLDIVVKNYFGGEMPLNPTEFDKIIDLEISDQNDIIYLNQLKKYIVEENNHTYVDDIVGVAVEVDPIEAEMCEGAFEEIDRYHDEKVDDVDLNYLLKYKQPLHQNNLKPGIYKMEVINVGYECISRKDPFFFWELKVITKGDYFGTMVERINTLSDSERAVKHFHHDLNVCGVYLDDDDANIIKTKAFQEKLIGTKLVVQVVEKNGQNNFYPKEKLMF